MANSLRIETLLFKAGSSPENVPSPIPLTPVTILVGPNNSGKSRTLIEIENICRTNSGEFLLVDELEIQYPETLEGMEEICKPFLTKFKDNQGREQYRLKNTKIREGSQDRTTTFLKTELEQWVEDKKKIGTNITFCNVIRLDGVTRFLMLEQMEKTSNPEDIKNYQGALFFDPEKREKLQDIVYEEFGYYLLIDPTNPRNYALKMTKEKPDPDLEEMTGIKGYNFFSKSIPLTSFGDGIKSFIGLVAPLFSTPHKIILVDEPEAFLHPSKARKLGKTITDVASEREGSLIVSSHSADFVMGCIESTRDITIIRLTYENDIATTRVLQPEDIEKLMKEPLTRSTGAINGLFHKTTIVCESDADRVFYDEINRILMNTNKERSIDDALFLSTLGKDSVYLIVEHLRKIGVPVVALLDFDGITGEAFKKTLIACNIPSEIKTKIYIDRDNIIEKIKEKAPLADPNSINRFIKEKGVSILEGADFDTANDLLDRLKEYGLFLVPVGELESWGKGKYPRKSGSSADWVRNLFEEIKKDDTLLRPTDDDIWSFLEDISIWVNDPKRKGV